MFNNFEVLVLIYVAAYLVSLFLLLQFALLFLFVPRNLYGPTPANDIHLPFLLMLSQAYFDGIVTAWILEPWICDLIFEALSKIALSSNHATCTCKWQGRYQGQSPPDLTLQVLLLIFNLDSRIWS
jgi:hypothetical protein